MSGNNFIPSVFSALKILEFLSDENTKDSKLSEISKELSINKSTCFRILKTLQEQKFVNYNDKTKSYKLGYYLISLGDRSKEVNNHINVAMSQLPLICQDTDQTVVLSKQIDSHNMIYIAKEEPNKMIRITASIGDKYPIIGGAAGQIYLAYFSEQERTTIIEEFESNGKLPKYTKNTITDPNEFLKKIKKIHSEGIAESDSEHEEGIHAIASPIFNSKGDVVLSIAVFMQSNTLQRELISNTRNKIKKHADFINNSLNNF